MTGPALSLPTIRWMIAMKLRLERYPRGRRLAAWMRLLRASKSPLLTRL